MTNLNRFRIQSPAAGRLLGDGREDQRRGDKRTADDILRQYARRSAAGRCLVLFDATSSMQPHWNHVCGTLHQIVERLLSVQRDLALKIVAYRDDCDGDRVIEASDWSREAGTLGEFVGRVRCGGGGDWPEAVDRALSVAVGEQSAVSAVVLIGDAPPHEGRDGTAEARRLGELRRPVFPIVVGGATDTRQTFGEIARLSGGRPVDLTRLEDLYDVLSIVLAYSAGPGVMADYLKRYGGTLTAGAQRAVLMLTDGRD